jgi:hypothetical protein
MAAYVSPAHQAALNEMDRIEAAAAGEASEDAEEAEEAEQLYTIDAATMRATRIKAAKHIHEQKKKSGTLQSDGVFKVADVELTNIIDSEFYYGGWTMVSSVAGAYATLGLKTAYGDASHMEGKGFNTFGCFFDIGTYSTNRGLCSIVSGHGIGPECKEDWAPRFEAAAAIGGFGVAGRVTVVDLEKSIDTAHDEAMHNGEKLNDERHVLKNMIPKLGPAHRS